jgi:formylglycine-generating enzyme required for sulfatase activity
VELQPGVVIAGKLRLIQPLGQGGMGVVWAARHLMLETDVAVKLIRPERVAADPALVARFEREARATARIAHPHVVQVMDYGVVDGAVPYLVMELLRGFSLAELLERGGRLSFATAKSLVEQVGSALESAHERGVVHRDVKPHNVFITEGSKGYPLFVKVLDFGVAKILGDDQVPGGSGTLTETGMVIGSPPYMSPEQLEGRKDVDLRSDLWSLGVIVYEALTGVQPFQGSSFVAVGAAVLKGKYRPASELRPNLPASIDDWFAKALCLDPGGRFRSAREMVDALKEAHEAAGALLADDAPPDEAADPAGDARPVAFATTVSVKDEIPVEAGSTAAHAPLAKRPEPLAAPAARASRLRRALVLAAAVGLVVAGGVGLSAPAKTAGSAGCPAGMALIGGATFQMGSASEGETPSDEMPQHGVTLRPFCLDATEVTVKAYAECATCEHTPPTVELEGLTPNGRSFWNQFCNRPEAREHPVNCVDWLEAKVYCASLGKRLPSEEEWELASRGTDARTYPWGQAPPSGERLNACGAECSRALTERLEAIGKGPWPRMYGDDDSAPSTAPVGHYPAGATPAGVLDLAGNVWEWTESHYCPYDKSDCDDSRRVLRGGGWDTVESQYVRAAHRRPSAPNARGWSIGFRCAKSP